MALDKKHYQDQGRANARQQRPGITVRCGHKPGTWQQKAWKEGYDDELAKLAAKTPRAPLLPPPVRTRWVGTETGRFSSGINVGHDLPKFALQRNYRLIDARAILKMSESFPGAAGHHTGCLVDMHNAETQERRRLRLFRSICRMVFRHYKGSPLRTVMPAIYLEEAAAS